MRYQIKYLLIIVVFTVFYLNAIGQNKTEGNYQRGGLEAPAIGKVSGQVIDGATNEPVVYATVTLLRKTDSVLVTGGVTNDKGYFLLEKVPVGRYKMKISFIGYKTLRKDSVFIGMKNPEINLGLIKLVSSAKKLKDVNIVAEKSEMTYNLDKKVVNVDKNVATAGGTAIDIMQTIPSVTVDVSGNVSLRGTDNVTILVDGKPSSLSLDQIPASMIDKVEVVTNPSAKYDPEGIGGILNIIMKKKDSKGYFGMVSFNAGTGDKYNTSLNINIRYNKLNYYVNYDNRFFGIKSNANLFGSSLLNDTTLSQDQTNFTHGYFHNLKGGIDYFINDKSTLSFSAVYRYRDFNSTTDMNNYTYKGDEDIIKKSANHSLSDNNSGEWQYTLSYDKKFDKPDQTLTSVLYAERENANTDIKTANQNIYPLDSLVNQKSYSKAKNIVATFQTDFAQQVGEGKLEAGFKSTYRSHDLDYNMDNYLSGWITDMNSSYHFVYTEVFNAAYGMMSGKLWFLKYQAGLRVEQSNTKGTLTGHDSTSVYNKSYLDFFPTLHLKYEVSEKQSFGLGYSKRINRPGMRYINPFINNIDPINLIKGNPDLKPEYVNSLEFSHMIDFKYTSLNSTLFYRQTNDMMSRIMTRDNNTGISTTTYQNLDKGITYGLEFVITQPLTKWWKTTGNFSLFKVKIDGSGINQIDNSNDLSWTAKLNNTFSINGFDFQIMYNYMSSKTVAQMQGMQGFSMGSGSGKQYSNQFCDIGFKKDIIKNMFTLNCRLSDVFKTNRFKMDTYGTNFSSSLNRTGESRILFIGLTYKINGGLKVKPKKNNANDSENNQDMDY
ncbi:MAG: outer membrane beta-barrel family protein [Bacteroidota bacterium]|nr:outer membrane beta-barrel family protein [Bacteroidota bacterium]